MSIWNVAQNFVFVFVQLVQMDFCLLSLSLKALERKAFVLRLRLRLLYLSGYRIAYKKIVVNIFFIVILNKKLWLFLYILPVVCFVWCAGIYRYRL